MTWFTGIIAFFMIWWTALFVVLPWGVRRDESVGTGAPAIPHLKRKFIVTTILTIIIWLIIFFLIKIDLIDFRAISQAMIEEDKAK